MFTSSPKAPGLQSSRVYCFKVWRLDDTDDTDEISGHPTCPEFFPGVLETYATFLLVTQYSVCNS